MCVNFLTSRDGCLPCTGVAGAAVRFGREARTCGAASGHGHAHGDHVAAPRVLHDVRQVQVEARVGQAPLLLRHDPPEPRRHRGWGRWSTADRMSRATANARRVHRREPASLSCSRSKSAEFAGDLITGREHERVLRLCLVTIACMQMTVVCVEIDTPQSSLLAPFSPHPIRSLIMLQRACLRTGSLRSMLYVRAEPDASAGMSVYTGLARCLVRQAGGCLQRQCSSKVRST